VAITKYIIMFLICMYLLFWVFLHNKKYLELDIPVGSTRFSTMGPCQPLDPNQLCTTPADNGTAAVGEICKREFICDRAPYCLTGTETITSKLANGKQKCTYVDHNRNTWPPSEIGAVTVGTRISYHFQKLKKGGPDGPPCAPLADATGDNILPQQQFDCQYEPSISSGVSVDSYVADVGNFTLHMSHSMFGTKLPFSRTGMQMKGYVQRCIPGTDCADMNNMERMVEVIPDTHNRGEVVMTLGEILGAVTPPPGELGRPRDQPGIDLDATSSACPDQCKDTGTGQHIASSNRWMGLVILMVIEYDNTGLVIPESSEQDIRYNMRFWAVNASVFSTEVPFEQEGSEREVHIIHGVRIVTMVKGQLGKYSIVTMGVQIATSIALVFVSTAIMDVILTKMMKNRAYYQFVKYEDDEDRLATLVQQLKMSKHLSPKEKENRVNEIEELRRRNGMDWWALLTLGLYSNPHHEVDPSLFSVDELSAITQEGEEEILTQEQFEEQMASIQKEREAIEAERAKLKAVLSRRNSSQMGTLAAS